MSWSDIFYPDNPRRRERVTRLHQELINCMELNFDATNDLIGALNTHCQCKLHPIHIQEKGTLQDNCNVLLAAIKAVQGELQDIDEQLKRKLEPHLYRKLHDFQEPESKKMQILRSVTTVVAGLTGTVAMGIFVKLALSEVGTIILSRLMTVVVKIGVSVGGAVAGILLGAGVDMIVSAILGAVERSQLEEAIEELEGIVKEFKPASKEYSKTIMRVMLMLS
ncbi:single-pass membrane and coiled-coil domain-containing protein 3-like [Pelodiscus sinensis]|uniref:Single-pass membrane and coiled-coil domain-containing protein 3-like n=1 Tax=Pelodiscus sinensis TaxID=13735 RepID=K7EYW1_PELSI|nr:single-pass membrane and coiled-coil domain-containing protein 3-like [Pelodiscus sinensis]|eukprot:XP_006116920.1 single-pass membrane and coiled-coil domain-containing protein 3-like [Pelodiscus sinensis]